MQAAAHRARRRLHWAGACLVTLAAIALATPARAADPDYKGWFAAFDAASTQPNSLDQHYANEVDGVNSITKRLVIDNDKHLSWKASVGYGFGAGLGSLKVSYWTFDHDQEQTQTSTGYVYPTIFGYGYTGGAILGLAFPATIKTTSDVKAKTIDVDYVRPLVAGDALTINWLAGLRHATYEETLGFEGDVAAATYLQEKHLDSKGTGVRFGITSSFGFGKHFALQGSMAVSFLQSKTDADASQNNNGPTDRATAHNNNVRGEIRDYDVRAVWTYHHLDYYVGYGGSTWDGLVSDPLPSDIGSFSTPATTRTRDSIAFNSIHGGVVWRFGKGR
jgi:hypothetical protein